MYSNPCKQVNKTAKTIVNIRANKVCFLARARRAWCAQVIVAPEVSRRNVFVKGTVYVFIVLIAFGGHTPPMLCAGAILEVH